jgi:phospholipid/cholesterol/gamma-HCH transport system substrate-binding protein
MLETTAAALGPRAPRLNDGVGRAGPALEQAAGLFADLNASGRQLEELVRSGDGVMRVVATRRQRVAALVEVAATTFDTLASRARRVQETIDAFPAALGQVEHTAARLQPTLTRVTALLRDLRPGAAELRPFAAVATPTLVHLRGTAADADRLAANATSAAPAITKLLARGTLLVRAATPVVEKTTPIAHCLTPYAPEIAGTLSNWASWNRSYDAQSHLGKIFVDASGSSFFDNPDIKATQFKALGMGYAALRPPGWIGHKPRFMPECGVGKDAVDPANDWDDK